MRTAHIYHKNKLAGSLIEMDDKSYIFRYDEDYFNDNSMPSISLTLPKKQREYRSDYIFPFFSNMIAEGTNLAIQSRYLKIDEKDTLWLLGATAVYDAIGAITVKLLDESR